jgi:hypothetical protein
MSDESQPLDRITFSNAITLSGAQWLGLIAFAIVITFAVPAIWKRVEKFQPDADYRLPRELSDDYWFYERYVDLVAADHDVLVLGDSVIWGEFVNRHETLSHYLNKEAKKERFANIGLNGAHPLALEGLVEAYAGSVTGKKVLLQCNPLWLSSLKTDLQNPDADVNHARLVPQFWPLVPAYKVEISPRIGILVERRVPITKWANHLQQAYYRDDGPDDVPGWTLKHPYDNPLEPLTRPLPESDDKRREDAKPWRKRGITPQDLEWIDLNDSLQWHAFQHTVETLERRGNRVFVLVGPFNEHMLTPASLARYQKTKTTITDWLSEQHVPHLAPNALSSDLYADASHPLAAGYEILASKLFADPGFLAVVGQ